MWDNKASLLAQNKDTAIAYIAKFLLHATAIITVANFCVELVLNCCARRIMVPEHAKTITAEANYALFLFISLFVNNG